MAADVLQVADDALQDIKAVMSEAGVKDLLAIFNSAVKTHRELMSDIVAIQDKESKEEEKLAKEYTGKVDELLKKDQRRKLKCLNGVQEGLVSLLPLLTSEFSGTFSTKDRTSENCPCSLKQASQLNILNSCHKRRIRDSLHW